LKGGPERERKNFLPAGILRRKGKGLLHDGEWVQGFSPRYLKTGDIQESPNEGDGLPNDSQSVAVMKSLEKTAC